MNKSKKKSKEQFGANELKENTMLPSIRVLAKDLRISILTVKKAYDELEQEGYLKTVQGKGSFVIARNQELIKEEQIKKIEQLLGESIRNCQDSRYKKRRVNRIIKLFI